MVFLYHLDYYVHAQFDIILDLTPRQTKSYTF
ncbi:hypothetical protein SAMN05421796_105102 [Chryseobacterium piscicola]|uniref:Uncharacterized protein n=1 Tax=Chryseobacterium piscicola TaxID=551459 RepID=A0A1N7MP77_9FLAO|nr:hypothetical protein SAMN05421796_105102 [Chryseobacterium piscicola]